MQFLHHCIVVPCIKFLLVLMKWCFILLILENTWKRRDVVMSYPFLSYLNHTWSEIVIYATRCDIYQQIFTHLLVVEILGIRTIHSIILDWWWEKLVLVFLNTVSIHHQSGMLEWIVRIPCNSTTCKLGAICWYLLNPIKYITFSLLIFT